MDEELISWVLLPYRSIHMPEANGHLKLQYLIFLDNRQCLRHLLPPFAEPNDGGTKI